MGLENCDLGESTELVGRCIDASLCKDDLLILLDSARPGFPSKQLIDSVPGRDNSIDGTLESLRKAEFDRRRTKLAEDVVEGLREPCGDRLSVNVGTASSWLWIWSCSSFENCCRRILSGSDK